MKRYNDYMDAVEVSDTLHEKLKNLEEPKKKTQPWAKWGAMAAAFVLVAGVGAYGLSRGGWNAIMDNFHPTGDWNALIDQFDPAVGTAEVGREEIGEPDIADEDRSGAPEKHYGGGYEVVHGDGPDAMVSYYVLPYLNWADASVQSQTAADYALAPPSAICRDASLDDVRAFAGGEKAMADHLLWDGLDWDGLFWFLEDGTPCAASLYADGNGISFSLEVMKGGEVPSCIVFPEDSYERSTWGGVEITALKNGGYMVRDDGVELREKREVSFLCNGVGYKLTLYAGDAAQANEMCARFVRYAVDGGFDLDALTPDGGASVRYAGPTGYSVGEPNWEDGVPDEDSDDFYCDCPDCIEGTVHTHPYDPSADAVVTAPPYDPNETSEAKAPMPPS